MKTKTAKKEDGGKIARMQAAREAKARTNGGGVFAIDNTVSVDSAGGTRPAVDHILVGHVEKGPVSISTSLEPEGQAEVESASTSKKQSLWSATRARKALECISRDLTRLVFAYPAVTRIEAIQQLVTSARDAIPEARRGNPNLGTRLDVGALVKVAPKHLAKYKGIFTEAERFTVKAVIGRMVRLEVESGELLLLRAHFQPVEGAS